MIPSRLPVITSVDSDLSIWDPFLFTKRSMPATFSILASYPPDWSMAHHLGNAVDSPERCL